MLGLLSILLMSIKIASISLVAFVPATSVEASAITSETVIQLANAARVENGLNALTGSGLLAKAAQNKANDMLARQYFAHNTPDGATPWTFIKAVGYSYITAGENLAIDFTEAESVQTAWMNSPGHRANILNKNFQEIGIGISKGMFDGHQTIIVVQMFGTPISQSVQLQQQPTPVVKTAPKTPAPTPQAPAAGNTQSIKVATTPAAPVASSTDPLTIHDTNTALQGNQLYLSVSASHSAVKLLAIYGSQAIMLDPNGDDTWRGTIPLAHIGPYDNLVVQAFDISGHIHQSPVAQFSNGLNSSAKGNVEGASISLFGKTINPHQTEQEIILIVLAFLLTGLILAIAIKRHVQHLSLIANTSFVAMLAAILLMT
jgi:uncharacterized protein YkwD